MNPNNYATLEASKRLFDAKDNVRVRRLSPARAGYLIFWEVENVKTNSTKA